VSGKLSNVVLNGINLGKIAFGASSQSIKQHKGDVNKVTE
jgi:hypothetical protein